MQPMECTLGGIPYVISYLDLSKIIAKYKLCLSLFYVDEQPTRTLTCFGQINHIGRFKHFLQQIEAELATHEFVHIAVGDMCLPLPAISYTVIDRRNFSILEGFCTFVETIGEYAGANPVVHSITYSVDRCHGGKTDSSCVVFRVTTGIGYVFDCNPTMRTFEDVSEPLADWETVHSYVAVAFNATNCEIANLLLSFTVENGGLKSIELTE